LKRRLESEKVRSPLGGEKSLTICVAVSMHTIPECDRQTEGQTEFQHQYRVGLLTRDKINKKNDR